MKKTLAILLVLTMVIGLFAACGTKPGTSTTPTASSSAPASESATPAPEQKPVEIRIVGQFGGTDPTKELYEQRLKDFMTANPKITVVNESGTVDEAWKARVATDFSSGNDPDVIQYFTGADAKMAIENKKLVSIEEIQKVYPDYAKNITDAAMGFMKEFDGNSYCVPIRGFYEGLFCNKDLFDKFGLALPTNWDNFIAAIKKFKAENIIPVAVSFSDVPHYWIEHLVLAQGGIEDHSINPKGSYPESWAKALGYFKELKDLGAFPVDVNATKNDLVGDLFKDKKAAMTLDGSWFIGGLKDKDNTVILPFPVAPGGKKDPSDIIGGFSTGFCVSTKAWNDPDKRDAAVKLSAFLTNNDSIALFATVGGAPAADVPAPATLSGVMKSGLQMGGAAKGINMPIDSRMNKESWTYLISNIGAIADGQAKPEDVLKEAASLNK